MEKKHLINENYFAIAWGLTISALYSLITLLLVLIPDIVVTGISNLFYVKPGTPAIVEVTFANFIIGLFEVFIITYFLTLIFAWIYNMFVITEINKKPKE